MKKITLCLFATAFLFVACTENYDCMCIVNGQELGYTDMDKNCQELESNISAYQDLPGNTTSDVTCTEI